MALFPKALFSKALRPARGSRLQGRPIETVLASSLALCLLPSVSWANYVTRYASYAPKDSAVFMEFRGEDEHYKAFMQDAMTTSFFKDLLSGNLLDFDSDSTGLLPPASSLPSSISPQTQQALKDINSINRNLFTATKIFFGISQKLVEDFEVAGGASIWLESPLPEKAKKARNAKAKQDDISLSSSAFLALERSKPHFFAAFTLRPGKTINQLVEKWDLQSPKTIPYHSKKSSTPLTLYFYQTGLNNKVSFYFFQNGQDLYITDSLESVQSMLQAQTGSNLNQSPKLATIVPALPATRQGTFVLQAPQEFQDDLKHIGQKIQAELMAPRERKETDEQYKERQNILTLYNKFWPIIEVADATVMSYELEKTPNTEKAYRFISRLYVHPNWNKITDPALKADLVAAVLPKTKTSFSRVIPEGILFSMGAHNLSTPYYLTTKHILPLLPEKASESLLQTELGLGLIGLNLEKDVVGLFDNLTGVAINRFDFETGELKNLQATVFLNGNAQGQAGSKNLIKTAQDIYKDTKHFSDVTLGGKPAKRIALPYREHGVRKEIPLLVATPATDILAFGTEAMVSQLPGLGSSTKALAETDAFKALAQGLPDVPLAYAYIDYHQYFGLLNDLASWAEKHPSQAAKSKTLSQAQRETQERAASQVAQTKRLFKAMSHFYGPGSVLLSEGYYDQAKGIFALDSRFTLVMTDESTEEATVTPEPIDTPQIKPSKPAKATPRRRRR